MLSHPWHQCLINRSQSGVLLCSFEIEFSFNSECQEIHVDQWHLRLLFTFAESVQIKMYLQFTCIRDLLEPDHWEGKWPLLHFPSPSPSPFYLNSVYVNRQLLRFLHPPTNRPISSATEPSCNKRAHVTWPTFIDKQSSRNLLSIVGVSRSVHLHIRHSRFSLTFRTNRPLGPIKTASGEDYLYR